MREHAIPQDITGYRFHIIGNMTLKQFAEIGAGCVIAFLFYTTNLPAIIKWPLIGLSVGLGAMVAFVPIEERPLDHWVTTFFKVLYKPTKFFWHREPKVPEAFSYTPLDRIVTEQQEVDFRPARKQRIKEYLRSVEPPKVVDQFDWSQLQQIDNIMNTFDHVVVQSVDAQESTQKPDLKVRVRSLVTPNPLESPLVEPVSEVLAQQDPDFALVAQQQEQMLQAPQITSPAGPASWTHTAPDIPPSPEVGIPDNPQIPVVSTPQITAMADTSTTEPQLQNVYIMQTAQTPISSDQQVILNAQLPFPTPPTEPNKIVGMCLTPNSEIISGAIVEIQSSDGQVARAVKTNTLGQFFITTPLENGTYTVLVEKDGLTFNPLRLDLSGDVVPPLEIRSL